MSTNTNPYASPDIPAEASPTVLDELFASRGCWRHGRYVVTTLQGRLPPRCVKFADAPISQKGIRLTWYPPWAMICLLLGPLFFVPLYFWGRRIELAIPLGQRWQRRKSRTVVWCGVVGLGALVMIFATAAVLGPGQGSEIPIGAGILILAAAVVLALDTESPPLRITYADQRFVWLKGAGDAFLNSLPAWPGK